MTCMPFACSRSMTPFQLEASANAPWTRTMVGEPSSDMRGFSTAVGGKELSQRRGDLVGCLLGEPVADAGDDEPLDVVGGELHRVLDHRTGALRSADRQDWHRQPAGLALLVLRR